MSVENTMLLPKGIRRRGNSLQVQSNKTTWIDGKKKVSRIFSSVPIVVTGNKTNDEAFKDAYKEAIKIKMQQDAHISSSGFGVNQVRKKFGVGRLKETFDMLFEKKWAGQSQEKNILIYATDVFNFFPNDIRLDEMQTEEQYEDFIDFVRKAIETRPMNNKHGVSNKSINDRLMILREVFRYALKHGLLDRSKLLNPDEAIKNMGWQDLKREDSKKKEPLSETEIEEIYNEAVADGELDFADSFIWLVDTGMRHSTEFDKLKINNVNFKNNTVTFFRPKTGKWSVPIPLTDRCIEIAKQRREASIRRGGRTFLTGNSRRRTLFKRYKERCNLPDDFTPYATRHTFITRLVEAGNPQNVVMDLAGHTCIETTMTYYARSTNKSLNNAIKSINQPISMVGHNRRKLNN